MKPREPRQTIAVTARMKSVDGWQDVAIRNVSIHGMRISVALPPRRGAYVEVRRAAQIIVARTMWVQGNDCGLRTQDSVDIPRLINPNATRAEAVVAAHLSDRRRLPRAEDTVQRAVDRVQVLRRITFGVVILAAAGYAAVTVTNVLSAPMTAVRTALSAPPP